MSAEITIVQARETSLEDINRLIVASKSHWDWPREYLSAALPLHRITAAYLHAHACFEVVTKDGGLVAFLSIEAGETRVLIDNFWVAPVQIGRGVGRAAMGFLLERARQQGWTTLWVLPDPPAEGFYRKMGFEDTGERVPSRVRAGPVFSVYRIAVPEVPAES